MRRGRHSSCVKTTTPIGLTLEAGTMATGAVVRIKLLPCHDLGCKHGLSQKRQSLDTRVNRFRLGQHHNAGGRERGH